MTLSSGAKGKFKFAAAEVELYRSVKEARNMGRRVITRWLVFNMGRIIREQYGGNDAADSSRGRMDGYGGLLKGTLFMCAGSRTANTSQ